MITEANPLLKEAPAEEVYVEAPYEEGRITVCTGLRGSGKTCYLAAMGMKSRHLWRRRTYSNFAIAGYIQHKYYETEPLPNDVFVTYAKEITPGSVLIVDEMQEFFDRQDWYSVQSKMGTSMFAQIRKLNIIIFGATQFFSHLNSRIAEQVDFLLGFEDLHFSGWGRDLGVPKGYWSGVKWYDLAGVYGKTARDKFAPHLITGEPYRLTNFFARRFWKNFNSHLLTSVNQRFQKFYVEKQVQKVPSEFSQSRGNGHNKELKEFITKLFNKETELGTKRLRANDVMAAAQIIGLDVNYVELGKTIHNLGIERQMEGSRCWYLVKPIC